MAVLRAIKQETPLPTPQDSLAAKLAQIKHLDDDDARLAATVARLETVANSAAAVEAEFARIAAAEADDVLKWAEKWSQKPGSEPEPRAVERADVATRLGEARAKAAAARRAIDTINVQRQELAGRRRSIEASAQIAAVDWLSSEVDPIVGKIEAAVIRLTDLRAKVEGARSVAATFGAVLAGKPSAAEFLRFAERLATRVPNLPVRVPNDSEIAVAAQDWRRALSERTGTLLNGDL